MYKIQLKVVKSAVINRSRLVLDVDPNAERLMVINRATGQLVDHAFKPEENIYTGYYRHSFALERNITVTIFDDNREYNAYTIDGIQLETVNVNEIFYGQS